MTPLSARVCVYITGLWLVTLAVAVSGLNQNVDEKSPERRSIKPDVEFVHLGCESNQVIVVRHAHFLKPECAHTDNVTGTVEWQCNGFRTCQVEFHFDAVQDKCHVNIQSKRVDVVYDCMLDTVNNKTDNHDYYISPESGHDFFCDNGLTFKTGSFNVGHCKKIEHTFTSSEYNGKRSVHIRHPIQSKTSHLKIIGECKTKPTKYYLINYSCNTKWILGGSKLGTTTTLDMRCPPNQEVEIVWAQYGRADCGDQPGIFDVTRIVGQQCNDFDFCVVEPLVSRYGDPCPGYDKFLKVKYKCVPSGALGSLVKRWNYDGAHVDGINCKGFKRARISIHKAWYGRTFVWCKPTLDIQPMIVWQCNGFVECKIYVDYHRFGGDPCVGERKMAHVEYTCKIQPKYMWDEKRIAVDYDKVMNIRCEKGEVIQIMEARYGMPGWCGGAGFKSYDKGHEEHFHCGALGSNCRTPKGTLDYTKWIQWQCDGFPECKINDILTHRFGDPCPGYSKKLNVAYKCIPSNGVMRKFLHGKGAIEVKCKNWKQDMVEILSATYGYTGHFCRPNPYGVNDIKHFVDHECMDDVEATFCYVRNWDRQKGMYGNPCGDHNRITVKWRCHPVAHVQWATRVLDVSSGYMNSPGFTPSTILGKNNVYPAYQNGRGAFSPATHDANQYIEIGFDVKVKPRLVKIYETYNGGCVVAIKARDDRKQLVTLWETKTPHVFNKSRIFAPALKKMDGMTNVIRLDMDLTAAAADCKIDAVQLVKWVPGGPQIGRVMQGSSACANHHCSTTVWVLLFCVMVLWHSRFQRTLF